MATKTGGTLTTTTLTGFQFNPDFTNTGGLSWSDFATVVLGITRDSGGVVNSDPAGNKINVPMPGGCMTRAGLLNLPGNRTDVPIDVYPGDWVFNDGFGNAIFVPQRALPKTLTMANCTTQSGSAAIVMPSNCLPFGWQNGTHVTGTGIPAGCVLGDIGPQGTTANLYSFAAAGKTNATVTATNTTITAGTFTHS